MPATIGSEIARISGARDALAGKMVDAGYELTGEERIDDLVRQADFTPGVITEGDTVTAADLAEGVTAHDAEGEAITGTMPDLSAVAFGDSPDVAERGYLESAVLEEIAKAINIRIGRAKQTYNIPIYVTAPIGATVTATKDGEVYYGAEFGDVEEGAVTRTYAVNVHTYGTYEIKAVTASGVITSVQTRTVTIAESSLALQDAYLQLKWFRKDDNGNGYIDTGLALKNFVVKTRVGDGTLWFGIYSHFIGVSPRSGSVSGRVNNSSINVSATFDPVDGIADVEAAIIDSNVYIKINGETVYSNTDLGSISNGNQFRIFYANNSIFAGAAIYDYFKIYSDLEKTNLIADLYPAMRASDGKIGMYDAVSRQFRLANFAATGGDIVS